MNKRYKQRIGLIFFIGTGLSIAVGLVLYALNQNVNLYLTPSQLAQNQIVHGQEIRLGGMVEKGSVHYQSNTLAVNFILTDFKSKIRVYFVGVLPALFREGQGVVTQGQLNTRGRFIADQVLAKHDEKYHPPEINSKGKHDS